VILSPLSSTRPADDDDDDGTRTIFFRLRRCVLHRGGARYVLSRYSCLHTLSYCQMMATDTVNRESGEPDALLKYSQLLTSSSYIETKSIVTTFDGLSVFVCGSYSGTAMFGTYVSLRERERERTNHD